jgi:hypothetical protein
MYSIQGEVIAIQISRTRFAGQCTSPRPTVNLDAASGVYRGSSSFLLARQEPRFLRVARHLPGTEYPASVFPDRARRLQNMLFRLE